ncbi:hypothetical protein CPB83DRAFT_845492 [Crepidotus variabilis]|uniref:Uncharacterized protein n=1 Tax=Crepidotus variabilis TaxID=179855 RepID=A0A9P6JVM1_9AGAR|nr:hypothetical protein CPB83DRAFT_845492 [Crepidotus variabilis]
MYDLPMVASEIETSTFNGSQLLIALLFTLSPLHEPVLIYLFAPPLYKTRGRSNTADIFVSCTSFRIEP